MVDGNVDSFYTVAIAVQTIYMVEGSRSDCFPGGTRGSPENPYSQTVDTQNNPLPSNSQLLQLWVVQGIPLRIIGLQCAVSAEIKHHCLEATRGHHLRGSSAGIGHKRVHGSLLSFASEESNMLCLHL